MPKKEKQSRPFTKINPKCFIDLNVKFRTIKLPVANVAENLNLGFAITLVTTQKAHSMKKKIVDIWIFIEFKPLL